MGAKITISVEEYNGFKQRIEDLEKACVEKDKTIEILDYNNDKYEEIVKYLIEDITCLERIFQWKAIVRAVNESLGNV